MDTSNKNKKGGSHAVLSSNLLSSIKPLAEHLHALKNLPRTGWGARGIPNAESVASHSHGVSLWCMWLAARYEARGENIQHDKLLSMALLHDLPESLIGDLMPSQKKLLFGPEPKAQKTAIRDAEERYWERLLSFDNGEDTAVFSRWRELWAEYRDGASLEARIVDQADALDCVMQAIMYRERFHTSLEDFARLIAKAAADDVELASWLDELWKGSSNQ